MKFSETIIIGLAMKRSYKSGSSKRFYKKQKEKQLNEILDKTRALDKLWTPMVMSILIPFLDYLRRVYQDNGRTCPRTHS